MNMVTQDRLKQVISYDPDTGEFVWLQATSRRIRVGNIAGTTYEDGYRRIAIDGFGYRAHPLAWLYVYGKFPEEQLDHINRIKSDNRLINLRLATNAENQQNHPVRRNNNSGIIGVHWYRRTGKWHAQISSGSRRIHIGYYDTIEEAATARAAAKAKYHTFHPEDNNVTLSKEASNHRDHNSRD